MTYRGGHGRVPGNTDPRQGRARGESYRAQARSGIIGVIIIVLFMVAVMAAGVFLFDPDLRPWGLGVPATAAVIVAVWRWRKRAHRRSIRDTLTDLGGE